MIGLKKAPEKTLSKTNMTMEEQKLVQMYLLLEMEMFQPAILVFSGAIHRWKTIYAFFLL